MSSDTRYLPEKAGRTTPLYSQIVVLLTTYSERAVDALRYSSAYLALIAMAEVAIVMFGLSLSPSPAPLVVGLVVFAVYVNDRIADADTDAASMPGQARFARRHGDVLYVLASAAYGLAVAIAALGGPAAFAITLLPGVAWILYATSWVPGVGIGFSRLKELFLVNTGVVALAWAVTLTFLPLSFAGRPVTLAALVVFVYFFLRVFTNTEIPNVRDIEADREIGVATLPVVLGVSRTRQTLYAVDLLTAAVVVAAVVADVLPAILAPALLAGIGYSLGVTSLVGRSRAERLVAKAAEFEYLVVAATLALVVVL